MVAAWNTKEAPRRLARGMLMVLTGLQSALRQRLKRVTMQVARLSERNQITTHIMDKLDLGYGGSSRVHPQSEETLWLRSSGGHTTSNH